MLIWDLWKNAAAARHQSNRQQTAKDMVLAASFLRSLETEDGEVNRELGKLAGDLERLAGRLDRKPDARAA